MLHTKNKYKRMSGYRDISKKIVRGTEEVSFFYKILSSDAIILPIAIGVIYGLSVLKEMVFLTTFKLPMKFISIDIMDLTSTFILILTRFGWAALSGIIVVALLGLDDNQTKIPFSFYSTVSVYGFFYILFFNVFNDTISIFISILLSILVIYGINKISTKKNIGNESEFDDYAFIKAIDEYFKKEKQTIHKKEKYFFYYSFYSVYFISYKAMKWIVNLLGTRFIFTFEFIFLLLLFFEIQGFKNAANRQDFYIANTSPECVVVYQSANIFLCVPFERTKKEIEPSYQVIPVQDAKNIKFTNENVGPLHLKPTPTPTPKPTLTPTITKTPLPTNTLVPTQTYEVPPSQQ